MYTYVEQKKQNNTCAGCMILMAAVLLLIAGCLSMCGESPEKIKARQDSEVKSFLEEKNLALDLKAAETMTQNEFRCYALRFRLVIDPAVSERRAALDAGYISLEQFKSNIDFIFQENGEQVFLECASETK